MLVFSPRQLCGAVFFVHKNVFFAHKKHNVYNECIFLCFT